VPHKRVSVRGSSRLLDPRDFQARADSPITRWNTLDWCELDRWKQAKSSRLAPRFWGALYFSLCSKTARSRRGFALGRILDLHKQELPVPGLSSGRQQPLAQFGVDFERMSGMQSQMVTPLPILRANFGRGIAKPDPPLCSLRQSAETGNARGLGCARQFFPCSKVVDKDTRLASTLWTNQRREKASASRVDPSIQVVRNNFAR
jgi:hypothetical protein